MAIVCKYIRQCNAMGLDTIEIILVMKISVHNCEMQNVCFSILWSMANVTLGKVYNKCTGDRKQLTRQTYKVRKDEPWMKF